MDLDGPVSLSTPAPYGRACITCARAKSKCVTSGPADARCERCLRLNKECAPSPIVRKRKATQKSLTSMHATKTARLEEKLDGLYSLLQSASRILPVGDGILTAQAQVPLPTASVQPPELPELPELQMGFRGVVYPGDDLDLHVPKPMVSLPGVDARPNPHSPSAAYTLHSFKPSVAEANENLRTFRTVQLKHFPFIQLPESMAAEELLDQQPFLWACIMAVSSKSLVQQLALGREVRMIVSHQVLVEGEKSLDLLQGLLTIITWGQGFLGSKSVVTGLIQLAVGLLAELNFNRPAPKEPPHMMLNYDAQGCPRPFHPSPRTMEGRRAAIACYSLTSTISSYLQKIDPPRWSAYLEESCVKLMQNEACEGDKLLACLVKLQLIADQIAQSPLHAGSVEPTVSRAPASFYLKALEAQLQHFQATIPTELQENETLLLHLNSTTLSIHEPALSPSLAPLPPTLRLESLHTSLRATRSWFDIFLNVPPGRYIGFTISLLTQMAHCIIALYRLSTFSDASAGWNGNGGDGLVRGEIDFWTTLDRLGRCFGAVGTQAGLLPTGNDEDDIWLAGERRLAGIKSWWDARPRPDEGVVEGRGVDGEDVAGEVLAPELWDESWLDILGLRNCDF